MKVVAFNGSPRTKGNTYEAIKMVAREIEKEGVDVEIIDVGSKQVSGCTACYKCVDNKDGTCIIKNDPVNEWIGKMKEADGIILGSPVYFGGVTGSMKCFLDRAFLVGFVNDGMLRHKVAATVVTLRRSGGMPTLNELNQFATNVEMILAPGNYWPLIYGEHPGEVQQDKEGRQILEMLGKNTAWLLKLIDNGKGTVNEPALPEKVWMNFIR